MLNEETTYLFHISKNVWKSTCNMYFKIKDKSLQNYLQLYPFSNMTKKDKNYISSDEFYEHYIQDGSLTMFNSVMNITDNYLLKKDGSFRNSTLLSPILFLVLQAVGKEISLKYKNDRNKTISVYYSGNYNSMNAKYAKEYSKFYNKCKFYSKYYNWFIKTDISNFFANINTDKLIRKIDLNCQKDNKISLNQLEIYKDFLNYCGQNRFPLVENSTASSYLATVIFLNESDNKLYKYISNKLKIEDFKLVRYVDDLYIFSNDLTERIFYKIRNQYSSFLKEDGLSINSEKTGLFHSDELENKIKTFFYGIYPSENLKQHTDINFNDIKTKFLQFLNLMNNLLDKNLLDYGTYKETINTAFKNKSNKLTPDELFNKIIYDKKLNSRKHILYKDSNVLKKLFKLLNHDNFLWLDPKRLVILFLNTRNYSLIKKMLLLFENKPIEDWTFYDVIAVVTYLTHRRSNKKNLFSGIAYKNKNLANYLDLGYSGNVKSLVGSQAINNLIEAANHDWIVYYLNFESRVEFTKNNTLTCYAFFKNYFDRMTAIIKFHFNKHPDGRKKPLTEPDYNHYYHEKDLKSTYSVISEKNNNIIKNANKLRNANPVSHARAGLLNSFDNPQNIKYSYHSDPTTQELVRIMRSLAKLLIDLYNYEYSRITKTYTV